MSVYILLCLRSLALLFFTSSSTSSASPSVIPAKAGIHRNAGNLRLVDSRLRGNDEVVKFGGVKVLKGLLA